MENNNAFTLLIHASSFTSVFACKHFTDDKVRCTGVKQNTRVIRNQPTKSTRHPGVSMVE